MNADQKAIGTLAVTAHSSTASEADQALTTERWITHPAAVAADASQTPIALQFRRELVLKKKVRHFFVRVSADNRYILFVNEHRVAVGPSRGDLERWRYQRIDLARHLRLGWNIIAAQVWNDAQLAPRAQITARTGFVLTADKVNHSFINSDETWHVRVDRSRMVADGMAQLIGEVGETYYVGGPPETHSGSKRLWDWMASKSAGKDWVAAVDAVCAAQKSPWKLIADELPQMLYVCKSGGRVVRFEGIAAGRFPGRAVTIPPNSKAAILLDVGQVQAAYPQITVSGGKGALITITYAESLYGPDKERLNDRAEVGNGRALGLTDTFLPGGGKHETYEPFWWRTWRFAEIRIKTAREPLRLERYVRFATGYPFKTRARFVSNDRDLNRIWRIGWNTVRLDAHETYMDTAYWEQVQYIGDTRIEALVSNAVSGDPRLPRQALEAFESSRQVNGFPQGSWPSRVNQYITPFSLFWIGMLHDQWMRDPDPTVVAKLLPGARAVLDWYSKYLTRDGLVGHTPGWNFIDWRPDLQEDGQPGWNLPGWNLKAKKGVVPAGRNACIITLMYIGALKQAAELEHALGDPARVEENQSRAKRLSVAVQNLCWSDERQLFADGPDKQTFSQHANVLAILYDVLPKEQQSALLDRITVREGGFDSPPDITGVTIYFSFYLARALEHAGLGDRYLELLATWRKLLPQHFTAWPERPTSSRDDSHAWGAHPTLDLLAVVGGIQPASPGFRSVRIAPHLGTLTTLDAAMAHPNGLIEVKYRKRGPSLTATIKLPSDVLGHFEWGGRTIGLKSGRNAISVPQTVDGTK